MGDTGAAAGAKIAVYLVGEASGVAPVRAALEGQDDIEVVGVAPTAAAAGALDTTDVDAVVFATDEVSLPRADIASLRERAAAPVILLAPASAPHLLEEALAADVADALLMPQPPESVLFALRRAVGRRTAYAPPPSRGLVVTVFSPKGGTGKSATATNVATALAQCEERRTLLVDLDLQFGDVEVMLGLESPHTLHDLVTSPGDLDADKLAGYTVRHESGLDVLAAPHRPEEADLVPPPRIGRVLEVARAAYEVVIVDSAPFVDAAFLAALDRTDVLVLVATPEVPALKALRQSLEAFDLVGYPRERIVLLLNRANSKAGITRSDVEAALGQRMTFTLPSTAAVPLSINRGRPAVLVEPRSEFAEAVRVIAADLARRRPAPDRVGAEAEVQR